MPSFSTVILPSRSSGARVYIDPTTYNDVEDAVEEFANELEKNWIELSKLIGGGMHQFLLIIPYVFPHLRRTTRNLRWLGSNPRKRAH